MVSILVCDDDQKTCELITTFFQKYSYRIVATNDGKQLIHALEENDFDLILLDLMLPGDDGLTLCQKIRRDSNIPIIMITANDNDIDRVSALELGADYYMTKPINLRVLMAYIKTILRRYQQVNQDTQVEVEASDKEIYYVANWVLNTNERSVV